MTAPPVILASQSPRRAQLLRMLGIDCGEPRLPSVPLSREGKAALRASLDNADFWNLVAM